MLYRSYNLPESGVFCYPEVHHIAVISAPSDRDNPLAARGAMTTTLGSEREKGLP
jgi:hypothetical protein